MGKKLQTLGLLATCLMETLFPSHAKAEPPKKPVPVMPKKASAAPPPKKPKPIPKQKHGPKLKVNGSLGMYVMNDSAQVDAKALATYNRFLLACRIMPTIKYEDGQATTFGLGKAGVKLGYGLAGVAVMQYLSSLPKEKQFHGRVGLSHFYGGKFSNRKLKFSTFNQLTARLTRESDIEWLSDSNIDYKLGPVSFVTNLEVILNAGKQVNLYIIRPFAGIRYKVVSVGGYMQVSGNQDVKPAVSGGVGIIVK